MAASRALATACSLLATAHCQMFHTRQTLLNNSTIAKRTTAVSLRYPQSPPPGWRNGIRDGLKHHCPKGLVGSTPTPGTEADCRWRARHLADAAHTSSRDCRERPSRVGCRDARLRERCLARGRGQDHQAVAAPVPAQGAAARAAPHFKSMSAV